MKEVITYNSRHNSELTTGDTIVHDGRYYTIEGVLQRNEWEHGFNYIIIVSVLSEETFLFQKSYAKMFGRDFFCYSNLYPILSMKVRQDLGISVGDMFKNLVARVN